MFQRNTGYTRTTALILLIVSAVVLACCGAGVLLALVSE